MKINFKKILPYIKNKQIILVGENHGVAENPLIVKFLLDTIKDKEKISFVGFEYPPSASEEFINIIKENNFDLLNNNSKAKMLTKDGRFSIYHFNFLVYLYKNNIPFVFFDSENESWDKRDMEMYKNISKSIKNKKEKVIIVAGNIHTTLTKLTLNNKEYIPLGTYFNLKNSFLINIKYHSGEYYNFGNKKFDKTSMPRENLIIKNENEAEIHLECANTTLIKK
ncbi:hypothetical protein BH10PAT1_BH10PAT1_7090 [soil metagenome]